MPTLEETRTAASAPRAEDRQKRANKERAPKNRGHIPTKRSINLATVDVKRINWLVAVPLILLILAACAAFGKFAVADRFLAVAEARAEVERLQGELDENYALMESFGDLDDRYAHYTFSGMTEEELSRVDRVAVMGLLRRIVLPRVHVDSWSVSGNVLTLSVAGRTLQEINLMMQGLLADELVDYCTVSTAEMSPDRPQPPAMPDDEPPEQRETVAAIVIVRLMEAGEEAMSK